MSILCVYKHMHLLYPFISRWTIRLSPCLGYCKFCCYEQEVHESSQGIVCYQIHARTGIVGSYGNSVFTFFEELSYCFPQWMHQLVRPQQCNRVSLFFTPSPRSVIHQVSSDGHSDRYEVVPPCSVDLLSLLISNAEHLFICLFTICVSSFKPQISIVRVTSIYFV